MTVGEIIEREARGKTFWWRTRRWWRDMSDEQRAEISKGFDRHRRACAKIGVDADPAWVMEAVEDAHRGRSLEEVESGKWKMESSDFDPMMRRGEFEGHLNLKIRL